MGVRRYYDLPGSITDAQIEEQLTGSLGESVVNIEIAKQDLGNAFIEAMPKMLKRFLKIAAKK